MDELRALLRARTAARGELARLAEKSGIAAHVIGRWRDEARATRPSDENLRKLAPALDVPYEDLLRMCGYLPGGTPADQVAEHRVDVELERAMRRWQELIDAGYPKAMLLSVLEANERMARLTLDAAPTPQPPVTAPAQPPVTDPIPAVSQPSDAPGPPLTNALRELAGSGARR